MSSGLLQSHEETHRPMAGARAIGIGTDRGGPRDGWGAWVSAL